MNIKQQKFLKQIGIASLFAIGLGLTRFIFTNLSSYLWLNWNLFLALIPILFAWLTTLKQRKWSRFILIIFWIGFLPNAPYIITDFIHLADVGPRSILWLDAIMIFAYSFAGLMAWVLSLDIIKRHLNWKQWSVWFIALLSGFGIYLGRYIRFNTWDIITQPLFLFEKIGAIILAPITYNPVIAMTLVFMCLLAGIYIYTEPLLKTKK